MLRKFIIGLLVLAGLAGLTAGVAWYLLHNESFLKKQVHNWFLDSTGRTMTFGGPLTLELGSDITLEAHQVSLSNASWGNQDNIAEVGRLLITADLRSLFSGKPILRNVEIDDCNVDVAENDKGVSNWNLFASEDTPAAETKTETGLKESVVEIDRGRAANCEVMITSPRREKPLLIKIAELALDLQDDGRYLKHAIGVIDGYPLTFDGKVGPIRALWQGGPFDHDVKLRVGKIMLNSSGSLADTKTLSGANISMNFSGPDISEVIDILALPPFSSGEFDFDVDFHFQDAMTKVDIKGDLGNLETTVTGELDRLRHPTSGNLKLTARGPNLGALAEALGVNNLVQDPFNLSLESSVKDGRSNLKPLILSTEKDRLEVNGTIGAYPEFNRTALDIILHSDDGDRWAKLLKVDSSPVGVVDATIRLTTDQTAVTAIDAKIDQGGNHLETSGSLGRYPALDEPDFTFSFQTPDLQSTGNLFRISHLPAAPATAGGRIHHADNGIHFEQVWVDLDGDLLSADGVLNLSDQLRGSKFNIQADIASTARFGELLGVPDVPDQPLHLKAVVLPEGNGLKFQVADSRVGDMSINLDGQIEDLDHPALVDSSFEFNLPSLALLSFLFPDTRLPDLPLAANGQISSARDVVTLQTGHFSLGQTTADISGQYTPGQQLAGTTLKLSASGSDWTELVTIDGLESLPRNFRLSGTWARNQTEDQLNGIDFSLGEMKLKLDGRADDLLALQNFALQAQVDIADIAAFNTLLSQTLEPQALTAGATLKGNRDQFDVSQLSAQLGSSDITGDIRVDRRTKLKLTGALNSERFDLRPFQEEISDIEDSTSLTSGKNQPGKKPNDPPEKIFDDTPVFVLQENPLDLDLKIRVNRLQFHNAVLEDIDLGVLREDNVLQLSPFSVVGYRGSRLSGELSIDGRNSAPELDITLHGKDIRLGLNAFEGQDLETYPPVEMHIGLHGSGNTRHEVAKSLEGTIRVYWGSGMYATQGLRFLFSDFLTELFTLLNPVAKTGQYSELECAVLGADVTSGIVTVQPILLHDKSITMVSEGVINLDTESLDLVFNSKARQGLGISAGTIINSFIKVGGTLASPAIEIDPGNAIKKGGVAIATVGFSVLAKSFADRFMSSKDPCGDARKKLEEQSTTK